MVRIPGSSGGSGGSGSTGGSTGGPVGSAGGGAGGGGRRRRRVLGGTVLALAVLLAVGAGVRAGLSGRSLPGQASSALSSAPTGSRPSPSASSSAPTTTTPPAAGVTSLNAVQVTGPSRAVAVGKGTVLATGDGGRTWSRLWRGPDDLRDVDFSSASTGWALGDGVLLATGDGGRHWRALAQPGQGPLRRVHFVSATEGWGIAGGADRADQGPMQPAGSTRLLHSADGGRTWAPLAAPAPPQSVCFTSPRNGWLASGRKVWRSTDGGRDWGPGPSLTLPGTTGGLPYRAELECADPAAAWVRFDGGAAAAGHVPYALYWSRDGGAHWHGVLAEAHTLGQALRLPAGPGSYPGPFSVIDASTAFLLSPSPPAQVVGGVLVTGTRLARVPDVPAASLSVPTSVSFASATQGWAVGEDAAGRAVILATADGGRHWHRQLGP